MFAYKQYAEFCAAGSSSLTRVCYYSVFLTLLRLYRDGKSHGIAMSMPLSIRHLFWDFLGKDVVVISKILLLYC